MSTTCASAIGWSSPTVQAMRSHVSGKGPQRRYDIPQHQQKGGGMMEDDASIKEGSLLNQRNPTPAENHAYAVDFSSDSIRFEFADHLIALRRERGLSQDDIAQDLGISRQAISRWERGVSAPDTINLIALAKNYDLSLDELTGLATQTTDSCHNEGKTETRETNRKSALARKRKLLIFVFAVIGVALVTGFALYRWHEKTAYVSIADGMVVAVNTQSHEMVIKTSQYKIEDGAPAYRIIKEDSNTAHLDASGNWKKGLSFKPGDKVKVTYAGNDENQTIIRSPREIQIDDQASMFGY